MSLLLAALTLVEPGLATGSALDSNRITVSALAPKASAIAIGLADGEVRLVDLATRKPLRSMHSSVKDSVARLTWSADGSRLAAAVFPTPEKNSGPPDSAQEFIDAHGAWVVFDVATGMVLFERKSEEAGHDDPGCALSPDGNYLVTWGCEPRGRVWGIESQHCLWDCAAKGARTTCAVWSPDGETIYCGDDQGRISFWRTSDGALRGEVLLRRDARWTANSVECVAVSHDGRLLAAGGRSSYLGVWDCASRALRWIQQIEEDDRKLGLFDDDRIVDVAFNMTAESLVATTSSWGTVSAWSVADGRRRWDYDFEGGNEAKLYGVFDPRGERVATWGLGMFSTAKVFAAGSGDVRSKLESRKVLGGRGSAGWSSDGRFFIARTSLGLDIMDGATLEVLGTIVP